MLQAGARRTAVRYTINEMVTRFASGILKCLRCTA
jgi:hypothetical protein